MKRYKLQRLYLLLFSITFFLLLPTTMRGEEELVKLNTKERKALIQDLTSGYSKWETAEFSGSMHLKSLFISPTLKIYMKKGEEVFIAVRVPLMGEVARVEIDKDSILVVNKMKKTYCKESLEGVTQISNVTISDVQDILLGRLFIVGQGTLTKDMQSKIEFYSIGEEGWLAVPKRTKEESLVDYGFYVNGQKQLKNITIEPKVEESMGEIAYEWNKNKYDLDFLFKYGQKEMTFSITLNNPKWGVKPFDRMEFNSKYKRMGIHEFIRSMF